MWILTACRTYRVFDGYFFYLRRRSHCDLEAALIMSAPLHLVVGSHVVWCGVECIVGGIYKGEAELQSLSGNVLQWVPAQYLKPFKQKERRAMPHLVEGGITGNKKTADHLVDSEFVLR